MIKLFALALFVALALASSPHAEMEKAKLRWIKHNKDKMVPLTQEFMMDEGIYARGVLPEAMYKGSTRGKNLWVRPFVNKDNNDEFVCCSELGPVRYNVRGFKVEHDGTTADYAITSYQQPPKNSPLLPWDGVIFLYEDVFAPADPTMNLIAASDDYTESSEYVGVSMIDSVTLEAGRRYILVTTGYAQKDRGVFTNSIAPLGGHDGTVIFDEVSCADVGCSFLESEQCSCDDICITFNDCCYDFCFVCQDMPAPAGNEKCASVNGDPHFHGFFGETYDVRGEPEEVFNVLSDHNIQLNTRYIEGCRKKSTVLGEIGLLYKEQEIFFSAEDASLGGQSLKVGQRHFLDEEHSSWLELKPDMSLHINTPDYSMRFLRTESKKCDVSHVDLQVHFRNDDARPHGLLGQTVRESSIAKRDVHGRVNQGEEILEGAWHEYKIEQRELFGTAFKYNRYGNSEAPQTRSAPKARPADMEYDELN